MEKLNYMLSNIIKLNPWIQNFSEQTSIYIF